MKGSTFPWTLLAVPLSCTHIIAGWSCWRGRLAGDVCGEQREPGGARDTGAAGDLPGADSECPAQHARMDTDTGVGGHVFFTILDIFWSGLSMVDEVADDGREPVPALT